MQSVSAPDDQRTAAPVDAVLHALMSVGRLMRQRAAGDSFDPGTYWLLKTVAHRGALRITELATTANLDTSTVSRHVAQLERTGLLTREPDPDDGRAQLVALTDEGRTQLDLALEHRRALLAASLSDWSDTDVAEFQRLLNRFVTAIDSSSPSSKEPA